MTRPYRGFSLSLFLLWAGAVGMSQTADGWGGQHNEASVLHAGQPRAVPLPRGCASTPAIPTPCRTMRSGTERTGTRCGCSRGRRSRPCGERLPKAMFLASAATHYLTDRVCIAHAGRAWYHQELDKDPWTRFLPRQAPGGLRAARQEDRSTAHLKGTTSDTCLLLPEPECNVEKWRKCQGSLNAYFDSMPSVRNS